MKKLRGRKVRIFIDQIIDYTKIKKEGLGRVKNDRNVCLMIK